MSISDRLDQMERESVDADEEFDVWLDEFVGEISDRSCFDGYDEAGGR